MSLFSKEILIKWKADNTILRRSNSSVSKITALVYFGCHYTHRFTSNNNRCLIFHL